MKAIGKLLTRFLGKDKDFPRCNLCDATIYPGDLHGYERDASSVSITGYFDYYFCKSCIERQCTSKPIGEETLGKTFIIQRRNGERSRITIRC